MILTQKVAPLVGAWIEILILIIVAVFFLVAPLVGAWIEILMEVIEIRQKKVAPLVGAWIEICFIYHHRKSSSQVAPLVGAWIEISPDLQFPIHQLSLLL